MDRDRTFDWAIVDDLSEGADDDDDDGGESFEPVDDPRRARNVRRLVAACIVGGVAILVLGVVGVRVLISELQDRPTAREKLTSSIHDRYQARYDDCVSRGKAVAVCQTRFTQQCANDSRWTPKDVDELSDICVFKAG